TPSTMCMFCTRQSTSWVYRAGPMSPAMRERSPSTHVVFPRERMRTAGLPECHAEMFADGAVSLSLRLGMADFTRTPRRLAHGAKYTLKLRNPCRVNL